MRTAREIRVNGVVQGVGFRWTAKHIADSLTLAGWVRNNADGSVSMAVEGSENNVDAFIKRLHGRMGGYIDDMTIEDVAAGKNRHTFDIVL